LDDRRVILHSYPRQEISDLPKGEVLIKVHYCPGRWDAEWLKGILMFDFDLLMDRSETDSAKWQKYRGRDIIPMWVADMDFPSPPPVIEALHRRISHGIFGYGTPRPALAETIVRYLNKAFQWPIDPRWIVWLPGLVSGLNVTCRSVGEPGDGVLTTIPVYPPFLSAPRNAGRNLITSPMVSSNNRWVLDFDDLKARLDRRTKLFLLCNPHNPTGRVFTLDELAGLAQICLDNDLVICSDEIHCDLVLEPQCRHIPLASLCREIADRTITLMAPSKTYNIPGLSCSFAIIPSDGLRRRFKSAMDGIVPHVNIMGLAAAQAAYESGQPWLEALKSYLQKNRDITCEALSKMHGLEMGSVEATYLAWIDARNLGVENPAKWFEEAGVGLSDGADFHGPGFVRLNFGCPRSLLSRALQRMAGALP
jgi:cysteine-S-conjugate beta-lyase